MFFKIIIVIRNSITFMSLLLNKLMSLCLSIIKSFTHKKDRY